MSVRKMILGSVLGVGMMGCSAMAVSGGAGAGVAQQDGLLTVKSAYPASESVQRIQAALTEKGMKVFAVIDHQQAAAEAQLTMPASTVVVFGNPKAGTPMMQKHPTLAIDLPLKVLVWEDAEGNVFASLNRAEYLGKRHGVPAEVYAPLAGAEKLIPAVLQAK